ncbi:hypothetical protein LL273_17090 [Marinobacter salarius]|uniref:hypothetical protein n=1 Tax=Marinobacter salarius TaxID=1420917 RepID=UPI001D18D400|nr:hypothetical protein [Marinobacter salarius]MCC4285436.1 hypothetical protein [Marinobacter salarius]
MDSPQLLEQVSILIAIWVAIYGIDAWRREHVGKRQIELAEDTLAMFYEAVDVIRMMRHPVSVSSETEEIKRVEGESEAQFEARKNASVVFHRYNKNQELFNKIHASRYRFMAQIGKTEAEPFNELHGIVNRIIVSARMLARLWPRDHFRTEAQWEEHRARIEKHEAVFWEGLEEDDPINPKLDELIESIEAVCQPVISGKGSLFGFLNLRIGPKKS